MNEQQLILLQKHKQKFVTSNLLIHLINKRKKISLIICTYSTIVNGRLHKSHSHIFSIVYRY